MQTKTTMVGKDGRNNKQKNSEFVNESRRKSFQKSSYAEITKKNAEEGKFNEEDRPKLNQIFDHVASLRAEILNL